MKKRIIMKLLLFGKNGQLGRELRYSLRNLGYINIIVPDHFGNKLLCKDLTDLSGLMKTMRMVRPNIIVNDAAYTDVALCEKESDIAYKINSDAPGLKANEAKKLDALLLHYKHRLCF